MIPQEYRYAFERTSAYKELISLPKAKNLVEFKARIKKAKQMFPDAPNNWYYIFERVGNRAA